MRLLQRYILMELLRVFVLLLSGLTIMLVFVGVFREATERGLGPVQVLQIMPYIIPSLLPFTIPATFLLTVCVVYGRMAGDLEITAAKAAGINVLSLLWPSFIMGAVLSLSALLMTDQVIPWAMHNIQKQVTLAMEDIFLDMLRSQGSFRDRDRGISITVRDVREKTLIEPTIIYTPNRNTPITLQATSAEIAFDLDTREIILTFRELRAGLPSQFSLYTNDDREFRFPMPDAVRDPKPRHLTIRDIRHKSDSLGNEYVENREWLEIESAFTVAMGDFDRLFDSSLTNHDAQAEYNEEELRKLDTEVFSRFSMSSSCIFFALLGGPFSIAHGRKQFLTNFFLCFMPVLLLYYPVSMLMMTLSKTGTVNPVWAMWIGNLLLLIAAVRIIRKVLQH
ncbi:putative permease YjgP/YjgQ family protein [Polystyrenella longa]|uniref:Putative permease YjgP/YjgQ family protein n=1 Tax=Polystyrenella longa TaxID=2528007 RepID=A0A518CRE8_9PLAN|nr:LptF/LptG family permease [Polystyrenella longa]QDU81802.1 putative permease YjgP/YjgQ family protein [Polystyrenella longa]